MGPLEAAHAARLLGVGHVVPMHYSQDVMPFFTGTPEKLEEHLTEIAPDVNVHVMQPGDDLSS
jgi:L-ascorbate metabolism protein UlaG (beta-lactamase superfamily)